MRGLGTLLLLLGLIWLVLGFLPQQVQAQVPDMVLDQAVAGGGALALVGLALRVLGRRPRRPASDDSALRQALAARGLELSGPASAWRAQGDWHGHPLIVRRDEATAGRYGRAWVLLVEVAGAAQSPWPLGHDAARLIEPGPPRYVALIPDALRLDGPGLLARIRAIVGARSPG
jgi:hypothetical protein